MDSGFAAILGSLITGVLVAASSVFSARIYAKGAVDAAKKQANAEFLSARRQQWMDSLRDRLARFMALGNLLNSEEDIVTASKDEEFQKSVSELGLLRHQIDLMLSEHEDDHNKLSRAMEDAAKAALDSDNATHMKTSEKIRTLGRAITKDAWEQSKKDMS